MIKIILVFLLFCVACGSVDNNQSLIVGRWYVIDIGIDAEKGKANKSDIFSLGLINLGLMMMPDSCRLFFDFSKTEKIIKGNSCSSNDSGSFKIINDTTLLCEYSGETPEFIILELDSNNLKLKFTVDTESSSTLYYLKRDRADK